MADKYFPIRTDTSCQLKWNWSWISLNTGVTRTCHRTSETVLTTENFKNFHNTDVVVEDRIKMLDGQWPESNCSYCKKIEKSGGISDRLRHIDIPNLYPPELDQDPSSTIVTPTIVEVCLTNTCNLSCLYCVPNLSSQINNENRKFGAFDLNGIKLEYTEPKFNSLIDSFWEWFPEGFPKLKRLHVLGGEPFYQKEFEKLLDYIEQHPNPDCELNPITNLMCSEEKLEFFIQKFRKLVSQKKIKRVDITCSIDCWGPEQEYVRWGIDLNTWERNFNRLLKEKWIYLNINQTINILSIKTMPELLKKLQQWNNIRKVHHFFSTPAPGPSYMNAGIIGGEFWKKDFEKILSLMPSGHPDDKITLEYMQGIANGILDKSRDNVEILKLITFLNEKDRRRNTDWKTLFPWLVEFNVV